MHHDSSKTYREICKSQVFFLPNVILYPQNVGGTLGISETCNRLHAFPSSFYEYVSVLSLIHCQNFSCSMTITILQTDSMFKSNINFHCILQQSLQLQISQIYGTTCVLGCSGNFFTFFFLFLFFICFVTFCILVKETTKIFYVKTFTQKTKKQPGSEELK